MKDNQLWKKLCEKIINKKILKNLKKKMLDDELTDIKITTKQFILLEMR